MRLRTFRKSEGAGHVNVTPLIDVVMCLIIFYLMVGHLAAGRSSSVNLPTSTTGRPPDKATPIVINVAVDEKTNETVLLIGTERVLESQLTKILKDMSEIAPESEVQIRADRSLNYGKVAPILTACRDAGLVSVKLVAAKGGRSTS
ncbi:MAG: biopolymer transporter ExbD [Phycisphaeraceae bacterium]|nr:biopolymer transporter ExbD [Phycisphaeraceae bacterium]